MYNYVLSAIAVAYGARKCSPNLLGQAKIFTEAAGRPSERRVSPWNIWRVWRIYAVSVPSFRKSRKFFYIFPQCGFVVIVKSDRRYALLRVGHAGAKMFLEREVW